MESGKMKGFFTSLRLKQKFWLVNVLVAAGIVLLSLQAMSALERHLYHDRQEKIQELVEAAHGLLAFFYRQESSGNMSAGEAQQAAKAALRMVRYGQDGYFWINDMQPAMVMHPTKPELDGRDLSQNADPNGKKLFVAFVDEVRRNGAGFVDYEWPKPGSTEAVPKISYVKGFEPWGWIVGTGIYIDDLNVIYWVQAVDFGLSGGLVLLLLVVLLMLIGHTMTRPVIHLQKVITDVEASGNLGIRAAIEERNEVGEMAASFDALMNKLQSFVVEVRDAIELLGSSSEHLRIITDETNREVQMEQVQTEQVATAMSEMSATVQEVAINTSETAKAAEQADSESSNGQRVVNATISAIKQLASDVERAADVIHKLESQVIDIGQVLNVIRGVAEQTNLLALNAAIEAARAGEYGRGFAVVADEVRALASHTHESTQEIDRMIEALQHGARDAAKVMESSCSRAQAGVEQVALAGTSLETITYAVGHINDMSRQIATAVEEQSAVAEEINRNVTSISQVVLKTSDRSKETADAGVELRRLAEHLEVRVRKFYA
jgi:methyl-accepting chemotaxis protein